MEVKIDINGEQFAKLIEKGFESFTKEELHDLCKQVFLEAFKNTPEVKDLLIKKNQDGYYSTRYEAGPLLNKIFESFHYEEEMKVIRDKIIEDLRIHHRDIIENAILNQIMASLNFNNVFQDTIKETMQRIIHESRN